jgi:hypothetical protein
MNGDSGVQHIREFKVFLDRDVSPAYEEMGEIKNDNSRKHIQKLIYTNMVDRFDYCIDKTLIASLSDNEEIKNSILSKLNTPILESDLISLMLSGDQQEYVKLRLEHAMRTSILRDRHSLKLKRLLMAYNISDAELNKPRVNPSTGHILTNYKIQKQNEKIPASLLGYCDFLYSRRNAVVHGGGKVKLSSIDLNQLKKLYHVDSATTARISLSLSLSSVNNTLNFYRDLLVEMHDMLK